jgi:hypothetical protein
MEKVKMVDAGEGSALPFCAVVTERRHGRILLGFRLG